ncbi:SRPBCC domain-containing protein [Nocardia aurantia]|uniref:Polyketide cyclase n=1 Tax=Nocardia aurantia TaxID=2585199 RepID=A0A7K0DQK2_9NOCA|nr:SRPBCC domain-containing protein [Nocardia aurantia]MQY27642.1 hypothetical protein [Nocardia aurantia]
MGLANAIDWPAEYLPGLTDNFVSNEIIVAGPTAADIWPYLADTTKWHTYYDNASDITFPDGGGPILTEGLRFSFATFGFPPLDARVTECVPPAPATPARLAWTAHQDGPPESRLDVLHAWLLEDLPGGRVRILTQESQKGAPAAELARQHPNPMLNGHQDWVDGLIRAATGATAVR